MKAKAFCSLAVLILLLSTISYSQTENSPVNKNKSCYEIMKEQSGNDKKCDLLLSLSGGYAGLFKESSRPNGFNVQADVLYTTSDYFGFNLGVNFSQFQGYQYNYNYLLHDTVYVKGNGETEKFMQINLMPAVSVGNIKNSSKFSYYITAGFSLGLCKHGIGSGTVTSNDPALNSSSSYGPDYYFDYGGFISGRVSYKATNKISIFVEPTAFSDWKESYESNYRINGGISLNL